MPAMIIEGSEQHQLLLKTAHRFVNFFSRYTTGVYVYPVLSGNVVLSVQTLCSTEFQFWLSSETEIAIKETYNGETRYLRIPYTNKELRKVMRFATQHLVRNICNRDTQEKSVLNTQDWADLCRSRSGNAWDGYRFTMDVHGSAVSGGRCGTKLTFTGDDATLNKIMSIVSGEEIQKPMILPKTIPLPSDGLMAKIDKWLEENV